jgi:hypothetical protein
VESDYILIFLQFIHNCYGTVFLWAAKTGPIVIILFWPIMLSIYYVGYKLFVDWPLDYRCYKSGGIGRASFSTDGFRSVRHNDIC